VLEIHQQVMRVLTVQALLPIISIILPLFILIVFSMLRIKFPMLGLYSFLLIMWFISIKVSFRGCSYITFLANRNYFDSQQLSKTSYKMVAASFLQIFYVNIKYNLLKNVLKTE
jgi:hypothetical protein